MHGETLSTLNEYAVTVFPEHLVRPPCQGIDVLYGSRTIYRLEHVLYCCELGIDAIILTLIVIVLHVIELHDKRSNAVRSCRGGFTSLDGVFSSRACPSHFFVEVCKFVCF